MDNLENTHTQKDPLRSHDFSASKWTEMLIPHKYVYVRLEMKNHFPKHYVQLKPILNKASLGSEVLKFLYTYTCIKYIR